MNYFKQGDAANADRIQAAFKEKGIDVLNFGFADKTVVYCSIDGCVVQYLPYSINLMNILYSHPDYQELELVVKPKFKVGDWVVRKDGETFYGGNYAEQITLIEVDEKGKYIWLPSKTWVSDDVIRPWTLADAKDGDVLSIDFNGFQKIVIFKSLSNKGVEGYGITAFKDRVDFPTSYGKEYYSKTWTKTLTPATKEQRIRLFTELEKAGYKWDAEKKELRKIQHYDIANFRPFDKVLVRCGNDEEWMIEFYCKYDTLVHTSPHRDYPFMGIGDSYSQCIPFNDDTKHLLGTTDMPDEMYINW